MGSHKSKVPPTLCIFLQTQFFSTFKHVHFDDCTTDSNKKDNFSAPKVLNWIEQWIMRLSWCSPVTQCSTDHQHVSVSLSLLDSLSLQETFHLSKFVHLLLTKKHLLAKIRIPNFRWQLMFIKAFVLKEIIWFLMFFGLFCIQNLLFFSLHHLIYLMVDLQVEHKYKQLTKYQHAH